MIANKLENTLLELLKIDSVYGNEEEINEHVLKLFPGSEKLTVKQEGLSIYFATPKDPNKKTIALYGHLDTVQNQQDKPPYIEGDLIYGCGASDMKAGLAIMLHIMEEYQNGKESPYNLIFVFYDKEEGDYNSNGLGPLFKTYPELSECDLAFVLEPTNNIIQMGCVGGLHAQVNFTGKSAHSARPWQGENALHKSWNLLKKLSELERKEVSFSGLKFYEVLNATLAKVDNSRNSIPGLFQLNLNYRFAPGKSLETAKNEVLDFVGSEAEVIFIDESPSGAVFLGNPILEDFKDKYNLEYEPKQAWTDIARLGLHGIPAVNFGPGTPSQAHQKNEHCSIKMLKDSYQMFQSFIFDKN